MRALGENAVCDAEGCDQFTQMWWPDKPVPPRVRPGSHSFALPGLEYPVDHGWAISTRRITRDHPISPRLTVLLDYCPAHSHLGSLTPIDTISFQH